MVLFNDLAAFHVEAFFAGFAHGEGFAGQGAVKDDGFEKLAFVHAGQVDAGVASLAAQTDDDIFAVNVVDAFGVASIQPSVQEVLDGTDGQVEGGIIDVGNLEA